MQLCPVQKGAAPFVQPLGSPYGLWRLDVIAAPLAKSHAGLFRMRVAILAIGLDLTEKIG